MTKILEKIKLEEWERDDIPLEWKELFRLTLHPDKDDMEFTKVFAESNHRILAHLHNLKTRYHNGQRELKESVNLIQDLSKKLLTVFVDQDYSV